MKNKIKYMFVLALFFLPGALLNTTQAQQASQSVGQLVQSRKFIFIAEWADPFKGRMRQLIPPYDFTVKGDSIISYLPYFGVSRMAPVSSDDAGIRFTSTDFTYAASAAKKESWEVTIDVKDQNNTNRFNLTVYKDGTARMNASSTYRDPISFRGYIKALP